MADASDLKSLAERHAGSNPASGTTGVHVLKSRANWEREARSFLLLAQVWRAKEK